MKKNDSNTSKFISGRPHQAEDLRGDGPANHLLHLQQQRTDLRLLSLLRLVTRPRVPQPAEEELHLSEVVLRGSQAKDKVLRRIFIYFGSIYFFHACVQKED